MRQLREWLQSRLLPKPVSQYQGIEVYRCQTDGQLIAKHSCPTKNGSAIKHECPYQYHVGHPLKSPVILTLKEKVLIWLKIVG